MDAARRVTRCNGVCASDDCLDSGLHGINAAEEDLFLFASIGHDLETSQRHVVIVVEDSAEVRVLGDERLGEIGGLVSVPVCWFLINDLDRTALDEWIKDVMEALTATLRAGMS